jgi:hypothetical protein
MAQKDVLLTFSASAKSKKGNCQMYRNYYWKLRPINTDFNQATCEKINRM